MRIAIISDIHGNLEALKSVLKDINRNNVDKIICLGDIVGKGVNSSICIELVRMYCDVVLKGNNDEKISKPLKAYTGNKIAYDSVKFNKSLLSKEDIKYLKTLPFSEEFYLSGNLVRLFHATPDDNLKFVRDYESDLNEKYKMFLGSDKTKTKEVADIAIYGHIHYQFMQKLFHRTLISAGSVGNSVCATLIDGYNTNPNETTNAHYLIIEGEYGSKEKSNFNIEFKSLPYDIDHELLSSEGLNPEFDAYKIELTEGKYRNMEVIEKSIIEQGYKIPQQ